MAANDKKRSVTDQSASLANTLLAAGAVGTGLYFTHKNISREGGWRAVVDKAISSTPADKAHNAVASAALRYTNNISQTSHIQNLAKSIASSTPNFGGVGSGQQIAGIRQAFEQAVRFIDPTPEVYLSGLEQRFAQYTTPQAAMEDIAATISQRTGIKSSILGQRFLQNVRAIASHTQLTGQLPEIAKPPILSLTGKSIGLGDIGSDVIRDELLRLQSALSTGLGGDPIQLELQRFARGGLPGETLAVRFYGAGLGEEGEIAFDIARNLKAGALGSQIQAAEEFALGGKTGKALYQSMPRHLIDPMTGNVISTFKGDEWYAKRMVDNIIPEIYKLKRMSQSRRNSMLGKFNQALFEETYMPLSLNPEANLSRYLNFRTRNVQLVAEGMKSLPPDVVEKVIRTGEYLPESPGLLAQDKFRLASAANPIDIHRFVGFEDPARRAGQIATSSIWGPSSAAREVLSQQRSNPAIRALFGPGLEELGMGAGAVPTLEMTLLAEKSDLAARAGRYGIGSGGYTVFARSGDPTHTMFGISSTRDPMMLHMETSLAEKIRGIAEQRSPGVFSLTKPLKIREGRLLGYSSTGLPVTAEEGIRVTGMIEHPGQGTSLLYEQALDPERAGKTFGIKGMVQFKPPRYRETLSKLIGKSDWAAENLINDTAQGIAVIDFNKDKYLHRTQMFTTLQNIISGMWDRQEFKHAKMNADSKEFIKRWIFQPGAIAEHLADIASTGSPEEAHRAFAQYIYHSARTAGVSSEAMGDIFGGFMSYTGPGKDITNVLSEHGLFPGINPSQADIAHISRGRTRFARMIVGHGQFYAGMQGSIEPRFFDILKSPFMTESGMGSAIESEIIQRMQYTHPRFGAAISGLEQAGVSAMGGNIGLPTGAEEIHAMNIKSTAFLPSSTVGNVSQGGYFGYQPYGTVVKTGVPGLPDFYVPGRESGIFEPMKTKGGGLVAEREAIHGFEDYIKAIQEAHQSGTPHAPNLFEAREEFMAGLARTRGELETARGGLLGDKLPGSRRLVGVAGISDPKAAQFGLEALKDKFTVGISRAAATSMLDEMTEMGMAFDDASRQSFLEGKSTLAGIMTRDPLIYQTSTVPVRMQVQKHLHAQAVAIAQNMTSLNLSIGSRRILKDIDLGLLPLLAGDLDADTFSLSPIRNAQDQINTFINHELSTSRAGGLSALETESIRAGILKDLVRGGGTPSNVLDQISTATHKMGYTQKKIGHVSNAMSRMRAAVLSSQSLSKEQKMTALSLSAWMEQTPISGKHMKPGDFTSLVQDIEETIDITRKAGGVEGKNISSLVRRMIGNTEDTALADAILGKGLFVERGTQGAQWVAGFDLDNTAANISRAMLEVREAQGTGGISWARYQDIMSGRAGRVSSAESLQILAHQYGMNKVASGAESAMGASMSSRMLSGLNRMSSIAKKILPYAKPLAIGTTAALAVGMAIATPPSTMQPPPRPPDPKVMGQSKISSISPESMTSSQPIGSTSPPAMYPNRTRLAQQRSAQVRIKSRTDMQDIDLSQISTRIKGAIQANNVNVRVSDNRRKLKSYDISDMLEE